MSEPLYMWTICESPKDFPGKFVVRRFRVRAGEVDAEKDPVAVVDTLDQARDAVPLGHYRMDRMPEDEPQIVEVWL